MTITKEAYVDLQEKYEKVKKLIEEDSRTDPASEPYLSKYSARQLLIGMKANIEHLLRTHAPNTKDNIKLTAMLASTLLNLGTISVDTEEVSVGKKHLRKCQEVIEDHQTKPELILITLSLLNEYGLLYSESEPENSKVYLERAEALYLQFKGAGSNPIDTHDLFKVNQHGGGGGGGTYDLETGTKNLEKLHTLTLYYLAQIYGALKDPLKSAVYCHMTLKRQLQSDDYEPIEWALNAATLSQFFMEKNGFKQARHHLAASSYMLEVYETRLNRTLERNEEHEAKSENFKHRSADVARCWAKYGLVLLSNSKDRLLRQSEDIEATGSCFSTDLSDLELAPDSSVSQASLRSLRFETLDVTALEARVTDQFVLTLQDARQVFTNVKSWLEAAHSYYTLDNLASDYIEIVQDQAQLYLSLSFFEDNPENQAKMHKRRADLLEAVLNQINPTYYMQYCKQLWFELAQTYGEILHIKLDKMKECPGRPTPHLLTKINTLVDKGVAHYTNFVGSFKDDVVIDKDYRRPYLQAHFHIGALHGRYVSLDKRVALQHVEASLEAYKKVVDYCETHADAAETIPAEICICREMTALLPVKIAKLRLEII